jgi:hypothetical protein
MEAKEGKSKMQLMDASPSGSSNNSPKKPDSRVLFGITNTEDKPLISGQNGGANKFGQPKRAILEATNSDDQDEDDDSAA